MSDTAWVIPRMGESGPEIYIKSGVTELVIPLRPGMIANLLDFCTEIAGNELRKGRPGT